MKTKFLFHFPLQNVFPETFDRMMLYPSHLINLLQFKPIVIEYMELPLSYLPEVDNGEYICQLNSVGVQEIQALYNLWTKDSVGNLLEDLYIIADLELMYRDGDYKQFLVKPKRFVDVLHIIEYDFMALSHNLGVFKSIAAGENNSKKL